MQFVLSIWKIHYLGLQFVPSILTSNNWKERIAIRENASSYSRKRITNPRERIINPWERNNQCDITYTDDFKKKIICISLQGFRNIECGNDRKKYLYCQRWLFIVSSKSRASYMNTYKLTNWDNPNIKLGQFHRTRHTSFLDFFF